MHVLINPLLRFFIFFLSLLLLSGCTLDAGIIAQLKGGDSLPSSNLQPFTPFGVDGVVKTKLQYAAGDTEDDAYAIHLYGDGKFIIAGSSNSDGSKYGAIKRFNSDGTLDRNFLAKTYYANNEYSFYDVAVSSSGEIVAVGHDNYYNNIIVVLFSEDGKILASSEFTIAGASGVSVTAVQVTDDQKILIGGFGFFGAGNGRYDNWIQRRNWDGSIDETWGNSGVVKTGFGVDRDDSLNDLIIDSDGYVVAVGGSRVSSPESGDLIVSRYASDGSLDMTFGGTGKVILDLGNNDGDFGKSLVVDSFGRYLISGGIRSSNSNTLLVRLLPNGQLDSSFDGTGFVEFSMGESSDDMAVASVLSSDGKIILAAIRYEAGNSDFCAVRFLSNGTLDSSYSYGDGFECFDVKGYNDYLRAITLTANDEIFLVGQVGDVPSEKDIAIVKVNSAGSLDASFGVMGVEIKNYGVDSKDQLYDSVVDSNGNVLSLVSSRTTETKIALFRVKSNGLPDETFGQDGIVFVPFAVDESPYPKKLVVAGDKIYVIGSLVDPDGGIKGFVFRLNSDGSLDSTFNGNGNAVWRPAAGVYDTALFENAVVDGSGVIAVGYVHDQTNYQSDFLIVKFTPSGVLDVSYGNQGVVIRDYDGDFSNDSFEKVVLNSAGKAVVIGHTERRSDNKIESLVAVLGSNGSFEASFGQGGFKTIDLDGVSVENLRDIIVGPDDHMNLLCSVELDGDLYNLVIVRLDATGNYDSSFGDGNGFKLLNLGFTRGGPFGGVLSLDKNGRLTILGGISEKILVLRLDRAGNLDSSFAGGNGYLGFKLFRGEEHRAVSMSQSSSGDFYLGIKLNSEFICLAKMTADGLFAKELVIDDDSGSSR